MVLGTKHNLNIFMYLHFLIYHWKLGETIHINKLNAQHTDTNNRQWDESRFDLCSKRREWGGWGWGMGHRPWLFVYSSHCSLESWGDVPPPSSLAVSQLTRRIWKSVGGALR